MCLIDDYTIQDKITDLYKYEEAIPIKKNDIQWPFQMNAKNIFCHIYMYRPNDNIWIIQQFV